MQEAIAVVEGLSNVQAVSLLRQLNRNLYKAVSYETVQVHLLTEVDGVELLRDLEQGAKKHNLAPQDSVEVAKHILMAFAQDVNLAPILMQAWAEIEKDDSLFVEAIVAVGLIANLILFMATTEMEIKFKGGTFKKSKPSVKALEAILNPVVEVIRKLPSTGG